MSAFKFLVSLMTALGLLTCLSSAQRFEHWSDLPACGKTCFGFAFSDASPPGTCNANNITCSCDSALWRSSFMRCVVSGDTDKNVRGCGAEPTESKTAVLNYAQDIFCPSRNESQQPTSTLPDASWIPVTTIITNITGAPTILTTANSTNATAPTTTDVSTSYASTTTGSITVGPTGSFVQSSAGPNATSTSAGLSVTTMSTVYHKSTLAVVIFVGAVITMVG